MSDTTRPQSISRECYQPCDTGADGWLVVDATKFRTVHLRRSQAEWFVKGLKQDLLPAEIIPLHSSKQPTITDAEREAVEWLEDYCAKTYCVDTARTLRGLLERLGGGE